MTDSKYIAPACKVIAVATRQIVCTTPTGATGSIGGASEEDLGTL